MVSGTNDLDAITVGQEFSESTTAQSMVIYQGNTKGGNGCIHEVVLKNGTVSWISVPMPEELRMSRVPLMRRALSCMMVRP